jgi:tetratricopeptide (TPR) repeat protein
MRRLTTRLTLVALLCTLFPAGALASDPTPTVQEIDVLLRAGQIAEAEALEARLLEQVEAAHGRRSLAFVEALDALTANRLETTRLVGRSLELAHQAVELRSEIQGVESRELIPALIGLAYMLHVDGSLEEARDTYRWSLDLCRRHHGRDSRQAARALAQLGSVEGDLGNRRLGEELIAESVAILENLYGRDSPQVTDGLFTLALLMYDGERFEEAIAVWTRALGILEQAQSPNEEQVARCYNNIGDASHRLGRIDVAFEYLQRALRLRLRLDDPGQPPMPQAASTYSSLADLAQDVGELRQARDYYLAALDGMRQWGGEDSYRYAETLSHLALLEAQSGAWDEALEHQKRALEIRRSKLGPDDPLVARVLQRLGALYLQTGDAERASEHLQEALAIQESRQPSQPASLAATLAALGALAEQRGEQEAAALYLERALATLEGLSEDHPAQVETLARLARVRRRQGRLEESLRTAQRGIDVAVGSFGADSPRILDPAREREIVEALVGDAEAALRAALRLEAIRREHLRATIRSYPERQALLFAESEAPALDVALTVLDRSGSAADPNAVAEVWDAVVRSRALVFDAVASRQRLLSAQAKPELRELAQEVDRTRARLAGLLVRGRSSLPPGSRDQLIDTARREVTEAERALAEASRSFLEDEQREARGLADVVGALPERTALVAIVSYRRYALASSGVVEEPHFYGAFVKESREAPPRFLSLGEVETVDLAIRSWRASIERSLTGEVEEAERLLTLGNELRRLVWDPLAVRLGDAERLLLVADGALHLVNPVALPDRASNGYVIEGDSPAVHFLTAERDLLEKRSEVEATAGLLVIGGPDFSDREPAATGEILLGSTTSLRALGLSGCRRFETGRFEPLPGALEEVAEVAGLWRKTAASKSAGREGLSGSVVALTGTQATEEAFKRLAPGSRSLHVATHGLFLQDECELPRRGTEAISVSALALAGANRPYEAGMAGEDGLLTAREISGLDLASVEWAVLSACDTGLGRIRSAEGVFGLRRAFAVAGARTVIMSLWKVGDESTREWMRRLYARRFKHGDDTATAVRQASLEVLEKRRSAGLSTHPAFWAAFVASGDWR